MEKEWSFLGPELEKYATVFIENEYYNLEDLLKNPLTADEMEMLNIPKKDIPKIMKKIEELKKPTQQSNTSIKDFLSKIGVSLEHADKLKKLNIYHMEDLMHPGINESLLTQHAKVPLKSSKTIIEKIKEEKERNVGVINPVREKYLGKYLQIRNGLLDPDQLRIKDKLDQLSSIDVAFLLDTSGSMSRVLQTCVSKIQSIFQKMTDVLEPSSPNIAFVGYKDFGDKDQYQVIDFTDYPGELIGFITKIKAQGGGDTPEDMFGGMKKVQELKWKARVRVVIHFFDAPCHGKKYHDFRDDYPGIEQDLDKELVSIMNGFRSKKIDYYMVPLDKNQNGLAKMCNIFKEVYKEHCKKDLVEYDITDYELKFSEIVIKSIEISLTGQLVEYNDVDLDKTFPPIYRPEIYDVEIFVSSPNIVGNKRKGRMSKSPFGSGSMRHSFFFKFEDEEKMYVAKRWKTQQREAKTRCVEQLNCHFQLIDVLKSFNSILGESVICLPLQIAYIPKTEEKWFTIEEYVPGEYVKHNNNYNFVNVDLATKFPIFQAVSHYSFKFSNGESMVVDIQGVGNILTDPVVHSLTEKKYGMGDLGTIGMAQFLLKHQCSDFCKRLGVQSFNEKK